MSKRTIWAELKTAYGIWKSNRHRYSWVYCPVCHHDLNGNNDSFVSDTKKGVTYKCSNCGCKSLWWFNDIVPWTIKHQTFTKEMRWSANTEPKSKLTQPPHKKGK